MHVDFYDLFFVVVWYLHLSEKYEPLTLKREPMFN